MPFVCAQSAKRIGTYWEFIGTANATSTSACLPFGLRSSLALFNEVADTFEWILVNECHINRVLHNLDNIGISG